MRRGLVSLLGIVLIMTAFGAPAAPAVAGCADDSARPGGVHPGGEWRNAGADYSNTRSQPNETVINASTVRNLSARWVFRSSAAVPAGESGGSFSNTPVIADGCMFLASTTGWVYAVNADTGAGPDGSPVVWRTKLEGRGTGLIAEIITGSPTVRNGVVYVGVSDPGKPYVAALDQQTGAVLWTSRVTGVLPGQEQAGVVIVASPVFVNGRIFQGFAGNEGQSNARGGYAILDASAACGAGSETLTCTNPTPGATGGRVLHHAFTINDAEYSAGYRGASVWCTAAADPETNHVYGCGGNPASKKVEAPYSNALLKIDMDPGRETFGDIVAAYKGDYDQYYPGLDRQPACDLFGDQIVYVAWSAACLQLDLDFGASPTLYTKMVGAPGQEEPVKLVGDLQKSGVFHAVHASNMLEAWTTIVGAPCFACNAASPANDGGRIYTAAVPPGQIVALNGADGRYRWAGPHGAGTQFQPVSTANGVVYAIDNGGVLSAFDAELGILMLRKPLSMDTGASAVAASSQGVAIARNTVYAASNQFVVAYGP